MHKSRLLNETSFLLVISLLLLVSQGFVAMQVVYLLIAVLFTGVSYLLPTKPNWIFQVILFLLCAFLPDLVLFLPATMRVIAPEESHLDYLFLLGFLLISTVGNHPPIKVAFVVILLFFSFYLREKKINERPILRKSTLSPKILIGKNNKSYRNKIKHWPCHKKHN